MYHLKAILFLLLFVTPSFVRVHWVGLVNSLHHPPWTAVLKVNQTSTPTGDLLLLLKSVVCEAAYTNMKIKIDKMIKWRVGRGASSQTVTATRRHARETQLQTTRIAQACHP